MPADICTQKSAGSQFSGKKKVYIAIGDEETIVANLWEKYRDLSYLCRWGRKKDKQICQEEELGISKLWLSIDNIKKLEKYREKTLGELERLDRENGSEYIRILKCYLETNGNIGEVATECFLHRIVYIAVVKVSLRRKCLVRHFYLLSHYICDGLSFLFSVFWHHME